MTVEQTADFLELRKRLENEVCRRCLVDSASCLESKGCRAFHILDRFLEDGKIAVEDLK